MSKRDYCQVHIRGLAEDINEVIRFIENSACSVFCKPGDSDEIKAKGYSVLTIGEELRDLELRKLALTTQIIKDFPALRITGLCEFWEKYDNKVEIFYSESGKSKAEYYFAGNFDGDSDADDSRWAWSCNMFIGCRGRFTCIQSGEVCNYDFTFPYEDEWWNNVFYQKKDGKSVKVIETYALECTNRFFIKDNTLVKYIGAGGDVVIPDGITTISCNAFYNSSISPSTRITSITIPESVTYIEDFAFSNCGGLQTITIPDSVTHIGRGVFANCKRLKFVKISNNITSISDLAFRGCVALKTITIPENVTAIGDSAFAESRIKTITIPNSVTSIGKSAFSNCWDLEIAFLPESITQVTPSVFAGSSIDAIVASGVLPQTITDSFYQRAAAVGYLMYQDHYKNDAVITGYHEIIEAKFKPILDTILDLDSVQGIASLAALGKLTTQNIDKTFLKPATTKKATKCIKFLTKWKLQNTP